jgi:hypothetical protein
VTHFPDTRSPDEVTEMRIALHHAGNPRATTMTPEDVRAAYAESFPHGHIVKFDGTRLPLDR